MQQARFARRVVVRRAALKAMVPSAFGAMPLEPRLLLCGNVALPHVPGPAPEVLDRFPTHAPAGQQNPPPSDPSKDVPLSAIPALHSDPGAPATIYMDFTGDNTPDWANFSPGTTPAFDQDGNPRSFSTGEIAAIREIFARVAELYSPFNVDVTTADPGSYDYGSVVKVVVGGAGAWLGSRAGGVSFVGSFTDSSLPNTAFVFSDNLGNADAQYTAVAIAHEAGHTFGLRHQSTWSGNTLTSEYNPGNSYTAPVMGYGYVAQRALWWRGTSDVSPRKIQDDMSIIASDTNGFGYKPDDGNNSIATAAPLTISGSSVSGSGIIITTRDADFYSFDTAGGSATISVKTIGKGATLDPRMELRRANGALVAAADTGSIAGETISANLAPGTYYVVVGSHGHYGDVGQYTISGSISGGIKNGGGNGGTGDNNGGNGGGNTGGGQSTGSPKAPTKLAAAFVTPYMVELTWRDNAKNESGFELERSTNGKTWRQLGTLWAGTNETSDTDLQPGKKYWYRIRAYNGAGNSAYSNVVRITTLASAAARRAHHAAPLQAGR